MEEAAAIDDTSPTASGLRPFFIAGGAGFVVVLALAVALLLWDPPAPNVLLITLDMVRADHLGAYGYTRNTSPNLDALAKEGAVFEQAYTASTLSAPSHASLLTGLEPAAHGVTDNVHKLGDDVVTLAERMRDAGYATGAFISYPLVGKDVGLDQGFETFEVRKLPNHAHEPLPLEASRRLFLDSAEWLRGHDNRFFLWVHVQHAHFDFRPPKAFEELFLEDAPEEHQALDCIRDINRAIAEGRPIPEEDARRNVARYDAEIASADVGIGLLLETLKEIGANERTTVVVVADHGVTLFDRVEQGGTVDHIDEFFEEVVRVPLVIRVPGMPKGRVPGFVTLPAVAETLAEVAGLPPSPTKSAPGLLPVLRDGRGAPEPPVMRWIYTDTHRAIRVGDEKLLLRDGAAHLYDVAADPGETRDLAEERPARVEELLAMLQEDTPVKEAETLEPSSEVMKTLREGGYLDQLRRKHDER